MENHYEASGDGYVFDPYVSNAEYHDYEFLEKYLNSIAEKHPDKVKLKTIGETTLGRDIYAIEIHNRDKPVKGHIVIAGGHHGTEPAGTEAALYLIDRLLHSDSKEAKEFLDKYEVDIIPSVNADQYALPLYERSYNNIYDQPTNYYTHDGSAMCAEARSVKDYLHKLSRDAPIYLTLDYHETPGMDGFLIVRENEDDIAGDIVLKRMRDDRIPVTIMEGSSWQGYTHDGILEAGYPYSDVFYYIFSGEAMRAGSPHNLVFETPSQIELAYRITMHLDATEALFEALP